MASRKANRKANGKGGRQRTGAKPSGAGNKAGEAGEAGNEAGEAGKQAGEAGKQADEAGKQAGAAANEPPSGSELVADDGESREHLARCMGALLDSEPDLAPSDFELRVVVDTEQFWTFVSHAYTHDAIMHPDSAMFLLAIPHVGVFREWLRANPGAWTAATVPMIFSGYCGRDWIYLRSNTGLLAQKISENYRNAAREGGAAAALSGLVYPADARDEPYDPRDEPRYARDEPHDPRDARAVPSTDPSTKAEFEDFGIDEFEADAIFLTPAEYVAALDRSTDDPDVLESAKIWFAKARVAGVTKAGKLPREILAECVRGHVERRRAEAARRPASESGAKETRGIAPRDARVVGSAEPDHVSLPASVVDWARARGPSGEAADPATEVTTL